MDDLISEFITETAESLSLLDGELVNLERNPEDEKILGNIFRIMHTIKGTCGFLGLPRLESVAHASENVLGKIRDKKLKATPEAVTLVLESLDHIKTLIDDLTQGGAEKPGDDSALIARLNQFAEGGAAAAPAPAANGVAAGPEFPHFKGDDEMEVAAKKTEEVKAPEPVAAKPAEKEQAPDAATQSIRVNLDVLESLMQTVSELVLTRNQLMQIVRTRDDKDFLTPLQQLSLITTELQEGVMKTRMQPIGNAWSKFPRLIRDLSRDLNKKIELKMLGEETELDRQLLEIIKDPLTHMVRNSCDHGLETPEERKAAGKSEAGTVTLSAYHEGGHIVIDIIDDGRGIPIDKVKKKALDNGLATAAELAAMSDKQVAQFIFAPGFSTAEKVTSVSGRGVGMDVVKTNIQKIGGAIDLDSVWGKGSKVSVKIPLTLAIVSVLLIEAGGQKFGLPQLSVIELVRVAPRSEHVLETINASLVLRLRDQLLPLGVLSEMLGMQADREALMGKAAFVAVCKVGDYDFGLVVDRVYDTEEIVVKPVPEILKGIDVYSGNTILGDGSVIMILDPHGLARAAGHVEIGAAKEEAARDAQVKDANPAVPFLLFSTGAETPKAVPLELVSRLEEIDVKAIELADGEPVVQYRGGLMRIMTLGADFAMPGHGLMDVIVFSYDRKMMGLVVKSIIDIVQAPFHIQLASGEAKKHGYLGSMIMAGKATDVVDVGFLLADIIGEAINEMHAAGNNKGKENRVLLVEDSPFFRNLTVPFLSAAGYKVTTAENGKEALDILIGGGFDMVVTDIEMPAMNGFDFASACRANGKINGIPIVAYTSSVNNDVVRHCRDVGMNDCIVKTDRPGLLESMSRCLSQRKESAA